MRKLKTTDVFAAMRLIKESGMKEEVQRIALITRKTGKIKLEEVGADFILGIMEGLAGVNAERKAYEFVAGPLEMDVEEIQNMHPLEWKTIWNEYKEVEDVEAWKAFFDAVASSLK